MSAFTQKPFRKNFRNYTEKKRLLHISVNFKITNFKIVFSLIDHVSLLYAFTFVRVIFQVKAFFKNHLNLLSHRVRLVSRPFQVPIRPQGVVMWSIYLFTYLTLIYKASLIIHRGQESVNSTVAYLSPFLLQICSPALLVSEITITKIYNSFLFPFFINLWRTFPMTGPGISFLFPFSINLWRTIPMTGPVIIESHCRSRMFRRKKLFSLDEATNANKEHV